MSMKLNKPRQPVVSDTTPTNSEVSRFIAEGDKRPGKAKSLMRTYRLQPAFLSILDSESSRTGRDNTAILKAALTAYANLSENEKNHWLLESAKI